jgi:hypothetical protein
LIYSTPLVGTPPPDALRSDNVAKLTRGEFTVASLGVFAADYPLNLTNIDFVGLKSKGLSYLPVITGSG